MSSLFKCYEIIKRGADIHRELDVVCADYNLSLTALEILRLVHDNPYVGATDIMDMVPWRSSTLKNTLDAMEAQDLIESRRGKFDARYREFKITPKGNRLLKTVLPAVEYVAGRVMNEVH